jgi:hypothetical protein
MAKLEDLQPNAAAQDMLLDMAVRVVLVSETHLFTR